MAMAHLGRKSCRGSTWSHNPRDQRRRRSGRPCRWWRPHPRRHSARRPRCGTQRQVISAYRWSRGARTRREERRVWGCRVVSPLVRERRRVGLCGGAGELGGGERGSSRAATRRWWCWCGRVMMKQQQRPTTSERKSKITDKCLWARREA